MTPEAAIARLVERGDLSEAETTALVETLLAGRMTPAQLGAIAIALRMKGETVAELTGAARALRAHAVPIPDVPVGAVDTCGTGGDGAGLFNVSTAASLVVAAAGVPVAKHGNRALSSKSGAADVLGALGVKIDLEPSAISRSSFESMNSFTSWPSLTTCHAISAIRASSETNRNFFLSKVSSGVW